MKMLNTIKPYAFFSLMLAFAFLSCKGDTAQPNDVSVQTEKQHPAQAQKQNKSKKQSPKNIKSSNKSPQQVAQDAKAKRAQHLDTGGLKWTTFDKIAESNKNEGNKKYLVDVYTEWCGWCKVMDKKTFTDPEIQEYLRKNFHIVKFDAEQKETVKFKNKEYEWVKGGRKGVNRLAVELLGNRMSYPTLVYLDENLNKITASPGYKKPDQLIKELKAIAGQ